MQGPQLREQLKTRIDRLEAQREETRQRQQGLINELDKQILASRTLYQQWETLSLDVALAELKKTGVRLIVE